VKKKTNNSKGQKKSKKVKSQQNELKQAAKIKSEPKTSALTVHFKIISKK